MTAPLVKRVEEVLAALKYYSEVDRDPAAARDPGERRARAAVMRDAPGVIRDQRVAIIGYEAEQRENERTIRDQAARIAALEAALVEAADIIDGAPTVVSTSPLPYLTRKVLAAHATRLRTLAAGKDAT